MKILRMNILSFPHIGPGKYDMGHEYVKTPGAVDLDKICGTWQDASRPEIIYMQTADGVQYATSDLTLDQFITIWRTAPDFTTGKDIVDGAGPMGNAHALIPPELPEDLILVGAYCKHMGMDMREAAQIYNDPERKKKCIADWKQYLKNQKDGGKDG